MRPSWPPGTKIAVGADWIEYAGALEAIDRRFRSFGYQLARLPILDYADAFLRRSGEEIRRRMYIFRDPGATEICLRPEMTIAACRAFIAEHGGARREQRLSYIGPVFRYDKPRPGRLREFSQAGVEFFGAADHAAADAEVLALAVEAIRGLGITETSILMGDLAVVKEVIGAMPLEPRTCEQITSTVWRRRAVENFLASLQHAPDAEGPEPTGTREVAFTEASRAITQELITRLFPQRIGSRSVEEIADRILERLALASASRVPSELVELLRRFIGLSGPAPSILAVIELIHKELRLEAAPALERLRARLDRLEAYNIDPSAITLDMGFRRGIEYYTSFIFEIHSPALGPVSQIVGGGRYDGSRLFFFVRRGSRRKKQSINRFSLYIAQAIDHGSHCHRHTILIKIG